MQTVSIVISAYNEAVNLPDCLKSVAWADEIIVINNESTDNTAEIARSFGAKVFTQPNLKMLNINKNVGFEKATSTWILNLDADERIPEPLKEEILQTIEIADKHGYNIPRKNIIFGKWIEHGLWWPDYQVRLFRRGKGAFACKHVHEYLEINGEVGYLKQPMVHENYQSISQFIRKMDLIYTENEVETLMERGYKFSWKDAIRFPLANFISTYYAKQGYKDGLHGLALGLLQSVYGLVTFLKIWERHKFLSKAISDQEFTATVTSSLKELRYWQLTKKIDESNNRVQKLSLKLLRKFLKQ